MLCIDLNSITIGMDNESIGGNSGSLSEGFAIDNNSDDLTNDNGSRCHIRMYWDGIDVLKKIINRYLTFNTLFI